MRGELPTVAGSSPYRTVRNTRESESAVCHYINHLRRKWPKAVVTHSLLSTVVRADEAELLLVSWGHSQACPQPGAYGNWVSRWASLPLWAELGWLEDLGWPGFSSYVASLLRLLTARWSGSESVPDTQAEESPPS